MFRSRITSVFAAVVLTAGATVALAPAASASAYGCTKLPGANPLDSVCTHVYGSGTRVTAVNVDAIRIAGIYNGYVRVAFFDKHNHEIGIWNGPMHSSRHEQIDWTRNFSGNFTQLQGGRICGSLVENGVGRPGACESVH